ncbi:Cell division cycle-related protein res2/pct1 [Candida viswanathii]|uniref:Transcription factor MBP1 n=1 Tax=Candida viswanathii TaxID=5486 RepID=A0A367Y4M4_9ASCO|nr:Cell division cycle-related protein res2/pct1 [Candida viswanathii]
MSGLPQVFRATYSNTAVYECLMNDSPIMRRCKDDWVNATQILKCCNFPKAKRTKILEKGVQQGLHEKVQGGFGRFQGTWIPLDDARKLAETYGVTKELAPVLFLDFTDPNLVIPEKSKPPPKETPGAVKRKYIKKPKQPGDPPRRYKTGKKAALQAAEEAAAAAVAAAAALVADGTQLGQSRTSSSGDIIPANGGHPNAHIANGVTLNGNHINAQPPSGTIQDQFASQETFTTISRQSSFIPPSSQQFPQMYNMSQSSQQLNSNTAPLPPRGVANTFTQAEFQPVRSSGIPVYPTEVQNYQMMQHQQQPLPQPQPHVLPPQQQRYYQNGVLPNHIPQQVYQQGKPLSSQSSNDSSWSVGNAHKESDTSANSSTDDPKKIQHQGDEEPSPQTDNGYAAELLRFFSDDNAEIPFFIMYPPIDFNINEPIDDEGHTPLHWAASIGNFDMIHLLMSKGANPLVVNSFGLNPLSKLISFNNCFELKNFPKVLDDLELCLINTDINGRTPLHYLCQFAKARGKSDSLVYYLKVILNKLTVLSNQSQVRQIDLMKNVLNHQDVHGDTCLHIAVRSGSADLAKLLLQYGSHDDLENINRETARQLIMQFDLIPDYPNVGSAQSALQQQLQLGMGSYQSFNGNGNNAPPLVPGLATPIQSAYAKAETPDTQRTTVQEDDLDDDDGSVVARVDKRHIDALTDNKENIFVEKQFDNMSTPVNKKQATLNGHQPLAVISEVDATATPSQLPPHQQQQQQQQQPLPEVSRNGQLEVAPSSGPQSYNPKPPRVSDEGKIIEDEEEDADTKEPKLAMGDLSSMVSGMINSLSDTYSDELKKLDAEKEHLKQLIMKKEEENEESLRHFQTMLTNTGILEPKIDSIEQGQALIVETIDICERTISEKEQALLRVLQRNQAYRLAKLVEEQELKHLEEHSEVDEGNDLINESQVDYAIELSELQLRRNQLVNEIASKTKAFGIDEKMYKYRKLLSLSCGVRVEEIDSLIDGIAESLTEGMS